MCASRRGFIRHNADLVDEVRGMEDRIRRRDILVDDEVLVAFYKQRLPDVFDIRTLKHRIRKQGGDGFLRLNREMLIRYLPDEGRAGPVSPPAGPGAPGAGL